MLYCTGKGHELLYALGVTVVSHASNVFLVLKVPLSNNHAIDFENASVIDKGTFRTRKTLEAWHTTVTPNAYNNSCPLPGQYNILFNKYSYIFYILIILQCTFFFNFLIDFLSFILPVEDCSSGSRKLVVFNHFSQRSFFKF